MAINIAERKVRLAILANSGQSNDFSQPTNCAGFGRIHHFRRAQGEGWPLDPLPIDPALHALGRPDADDVSVQVFQIAVCNFRCWYCYVDRYLIEALPERSGFLSVQEMLDLFLAEQGRPPIVDLSGGQPDLVPEWTLWFADIVHDRGLGAEMYLWSDDNLSTDFLWRYLSRKEIGRLASYENHGRVGCFKGFDDYSFTFNTGAARELFRVQFSLMRRLVESGFDVYGYVTLTTDRDRNLDSLMADFVDRLQSEIHPLFPLRTIPQRIMEFTPTRRRTDARRQKALEIQDEAAYLWQEEINKRFPLDIRKKHIYEHKLVV